MRLHKLLISVMFLGLLSLLAVPFLLSAKAGATSECTLEPVNGSMALMRDIAAPGLQILDLKNRTQGSYAPGLDAANGRLASVSTEIEAGIITHSWACHQISHSKPLWLINQSLLI